MVNSNTILKGKFKIKLDTTEKLLFKTFKKNFN